MKRSLLIPTVTLTMCIGHFLMVGEAARCQEAAESPATEASDPTADWYYGNGEAPKAVEKTIPQQKAIQRAEQRMARLESLKWYGFSPGRPTATALPFTSMYSPAWTRPGPRPYAWYTGQRAEIIVPPINYGLR